MDEITKKKIESINFVLEKVFKDSPAAKDNAKFFAAYTFSKLEDKNLEDTLNIINEKKEEQ